MPKPKNRANALTLMLCLLLTLSLTGCLEVMVQAIDKTMPKAPKLDISPYWIFDKAYSLNPDNQDIDSDYFQGLGAYISNEQIIVGTDRIADPDLKVLKVRTYEYFLTRYKITPQSVGLRAQTMAVYTVTDAKGFSARIYRVADDRIALERNAILLFFRKTDQLKNTGIAVSTDSQGLPLKGGSSGANGVLIGLRQARSQGEGTLGPAAYRTLWIAQEEGEPLKIYEVKDILFPRSVFYKLAVERQENIDVVRETIAIKNLESGSVFREEAPAEGLSRFSDLTFISNDYFSAATRLSPDKKPGELRLYSTRNVSNPDYDGRISISGLFGPEGVNVMESAAQIALASADAAQTAHLGSLQEEDFILKRYNGRWIYEGRINSLEEYGQNDLTFPMNFRDNYRVYRYDTLKPRWTGILRSVADALDAVSSPDNFFAVVRTKGELRVLAKDEAGSLTGETLAVIPLKDEEIVMHEWAMGDFVEEWTKTVARQGKRLDD